MIIILYSVHVLLTADPEICTVLDWAMVQCTYSTVCNCRDYLILMVFSYVRENLQLLIHELIPGNCVVYHTTRA